MKKVLVLAAVLISFPALTFAQTRSGCPRQNEVPLFVWLAIQRVQPLLTPPPLKKPYSYESVTRIDQDEYNYHYGIVPLPKDFNSNMPIIRPDPTKWYPSVNERQNRMHKLPGIRIPDKGRPMIITR
ncbi:MAG: hypothetical protein A2X22_06950 [Bacteroidetes bacterium GWF2_49_14]|nr:MAG: hypothetical protein A2X22_06950 [Bacteroidetes bacterium GWF2_49_14]HBB90309.1 hypothetical protein [Bacteroidales bacterium]